MNREEKYHVFKELHERPGAFVIPNPWNAGSAKILTSLGFEALATTSSGYAFSAGHPDSVSRLTRQGVLDNAREIVEATDLPVSADLLNGFGDAPEICAETIGLAADIGLAGGSIEDSTDDDDRPIYEFELAVERVAAAAETARARNFLLTARAENYLHGRPDLDDTIRRLQAFEAAGADVLYAPGLSSMDDIRAVCSAVSKPVNVLVGSKGTSFTVDALAEAGVSRISVGGAMALAGLGAFVRAAREVREHGTFTYGADALSHADATRFME